MASCIGVLALGACADDPTDVQIETEQPAGDSETSNESEQNEGPVIVCEPGEARCADEFTLEVCAPTGLEWEASRCGTHQECDAAACAGPCEHLEDAPTS